MPRDHHFAFAKRVLPQQVFQNPERVFAELRGPMREPFLFFLWQELGKTVPQALPHCAPGVKHPGGMEELISLDVAGADVRQGIEVVVVQLPPPEQPSEAWYVALVRSVRGVRVFTWERSNETDAVLAEVRPDGRANFGFFPNWSLQGFLDALGELVGVHLQDLPKPASTPVDAAHAAGMAPRGTRPGAKLGKSLAAMALARAGISAFLWVAGIVAPGLIFGLGDTFDLVLRWGETLLELAIGVTTLMWLYRTFSDMKGRTRYSPGWAVGSWFIPIANFILPAFVLKDAWRSSRGSERGSGLVYGFWTAWIAQTVFTIANTPMGDGLPPLADLWLQATIEVLPNPEAAFMLYSFATVAVTVTCYGLLALVVRKISLEP